MCSLVIVYVHRLNLLTDKAAETQSTRALPRPAAAVFGVDDDDVRIETQCIKALILQSNTQQKKRKLVKIEYTDEELRARGLNPEGESMVLQHNISTHCIQRSERKPSKR